MTIVACAAQVAIQATTLLLVHCIGVDRSQLGCGAKQLKHQRRLVTLVAAHIKQYLGGLVGNFCWFGLKCLDE